MNLGRGHTACALLLVLGLIPSVVFRADWTDPQVILDFPPGIEKYGYLECVDAKGNLVFNDGYRSAIAIVSPEGDLVRHIDTPDHVLEKYLIYWPHKVYLLADTGNILVNVGRAESMWCIVDYEGRLINTIYSRCGWYNVYIYPDGSFIFLQIKGPSTGRLFYDLSKIPNEYHNTSGLYHFIYSLYDYEGKPLRVLNNPPLERGDDNLVEGRKRDGKYLSETRFANMSFVGLHTATSGFNRDHHGGFIEGSFDGYSSTGVLISTLRRYDNLGQLIGRFDLRYDGSNSPLIAELRERYGKDAVRFLDHSVLDEHMNAYTTISSKEGHVYVFKSEWTDAPVKDPPPPPIRIEPLDGYGFDPETSPIKGSPPFETEAKGNRLEFVFPEQEVPLWGRRYPAYSLWHYTLSAYMRENPAAVGGEPVWKWHAWVNLDLREAEQKRIGATVRQNLIKTENREKRYEFFEYGKGCSDQDKGRKKRCGIRYHSRDHESLLTFERLEHTEAPLDPEKIDTIRLSDTNLWDTVFWPALYVHETDLDSRIFQTCNILLRFQANEGADEEGSIRSMRAYCAVPGPRIRMLTLTETAPGSMRYASGDGAIYELAHILDEEKRPVGRLSPDRMEYLLFRVTDPALGLVRETVLLYETGIRTGLFESWYDFDYRRTYAPMLDKPWHQVEREVGLAKFHVRLSGGDVQEGSSLRVTWDEPNAGPRFRDVPLKPEEGGGWITATPLLCFTPTGCDAGRTWEETEDLPTPQLPDVVTFRDKSVKWEIVSVP